MSVLDATTGAFPRVERLLEESWEDRARRASRRELRSESLAAAAFALAAVSLLVVAGAPGFDPLAAGVLVAGYAVVSRIEFPVGAGYVVPSQLVLVPMLVLLPPATVPALAAAGLFCGALLDLALRRGHPERLLFSLPDAWHAVGAALVFVAAGSPGPDELRAPVLVGAFAACCAFDLLSAMVREAGALGIRPQVQARVFGLVWTVDACLVPVGYLAAVQAGDGPGAVGLVAPLSGLLLLLARDRRRRIDMAHGRLELVRHERTRLQSAVRRLGEAFAAKLDLQSVLAIALRASVEALDADAGRLSFAAGGQRVELTEPEDQTDLVPAAGPQGPVHVGEHWAMTLPLDPPDEALRAHGSITIARRDRPFEPDEVTLFTELVERVRTAASEVLAHRRLQEQALTDQLTGLGNRRQLRQDLDGCFAGGREGLLALFDLNGFKHFNDRHGHLAGDRLLERLGVALSAAVTPGGTAYRLGGDEFCVLLPYERASAATELGAAAAALTESGDGYTITTAYGVVLLPHEAADADAALQVADERMYAQKRGRDVTGQRHAADALMDALASRAPGLRNHAAEVGALAVETGRRLGLDERALGELELAAELHDIGKVAVSDAILEKPGPLDELEWEIVRRHTVLGQELLEATEALRPLAPIVRASHERWDGGGYPDRLAGDAIPLGARIIAVCDAYDAMTSDRSYRRRLPGDLALQELAETAGSQFDPEVVDAFLSGRRRIGQPA